MKRILVFFCFIFCGVLIVQSQETWHSELEKILEPLKEIKDKDNEDYEKSCKIFESATKLIKKNIGDSSDMYMSYSNVLNELYIRTNQIQKAGNGCLENYARCKKYKERNTKNFIDATKRLADFYLTFENVDAADTLYRELLNYYPDNSYFKVDILSILASINVHRNDYFQAEIYGLNALKSCEKLSKNNIYTTILHVKILNTLGVVYTNIKRFSKANEYLFKAIEIVNKEQNKEYSVYLEEAYAESLIHLGRVYINRYDFDTAEKYLLKSLKYGSDNEKLHSITYYSLAKIYIEKLDYKLASKCLLKVFDFYQKSKNYNRIYYNVISMMVKYNVAAQNNKIETLLRILKTVKLRYGETDGLYIKNLRNLALCYAEQGDIKKAWNYHVNEIDKRLRQLLDDMLSLTEQDKFRYVKFMDYRYNNLHSFVFKHHVKHRYIVHDLLNFLLISKKLILTNTIKLKQIIENSDNESVKSNYKELKAIKKRINKKDINQDTLITLKNNADKLQKEIALKIQSQYMDIVYSDIPNFNTIKNNISENEAIIQFTDFNKTHDSNFESYIIQDTTFYCALIAKKNFKHPKLIYLCTKKELENALSKETPITNTARHIKNIYDTDSKLYQYLFEKIEPYIKDVKVVNISPSGLVHNVAFSCLKDNAGKYLKDKYMIKYYISFADLCSDEKNISINSQNTHKAVLFGDMKYDLNSKEIKKIEQQNSTRGINSSLWFENESLDLSPLPATKQEVDSIEDIFSKNNISCTKYTGTDANEDNFYKLDASNTDILHVATHGFYFANENEQRQLLPTMPNLNPIDNSYFKNGLFFSGARNSLRNEAAMANISDGILSAYEICNLNLANVKLVVLSACLTGVGDIKQNEGVIGLSRAFKIAGAKYLLISLWKVPSRQTSEFMINFYKNTLSGISIEQAFNKAQQFMSKRYKNPYFWGGFILLK